MARSTITEPCSGSQVPDLELVVLVKMLRAVFPSGSREDGPLLGAAAFSFISILDRRPKTAKVFTLRVS